MMINKSIMIVIATLLMTSCGDEEKGKLDNRIKDYWSAKINKDFKTTYQFLSPGWRKNESEEAYIRRVSKTAVNWLGIEVKEKKCKAVNLCDVIIQVEYEYQFKGAMSQKMNVASEIDETWLMKDNVWYHIPKLAKIK